MCWCDQGKRTPCCGTVKCHDAAIQAGVLERGASCSLCHPPKAPAKCKHGVVIEVIADDAPVPHGEFQGPACLRCLKEQWLLAQERKAERDQLETDLEATRAELRKLEAAHPPPQPLEVLEERLKKANETLRVVGILAMACPGGVASEALTLLLRAYQEGSVWPSH